LHRGERSAAIAPDERCSGHRDFSGSIRAGRDHDLSAILGLGLIAGVLASFESGARADADAGIECGTVLSGEDLSALPALGRAYQDPGGTRGSSAPLYVPIVFHIIRQSDGTGGLTRVTSPATSTKTAT